MSRRRGWFRSFIRLLVWSTALLALVTLKGCGLNKWARRYFAWVADAVPEMRGLFLEDRGLSKAKNKHPEDAVRDIEEAIRLAPDDPQVLLTMAKAYEELAMPDDAVRYYERAIAMPAPEWGDTFRASVRERIDRLQREQALRK